MDIGLDGAIVTTPLSEVVGEEVAQEQVVVQEQVQEEDKGPDLAAELAQYKQYIEDLNAKLKPYQEWEQRQRQAQLDQLMDRVFNAGVGQQLEQAAEQGDRAGAERVMAGANLSEQDKQTIRQLMQYGAQYARQEPTMRAERTVAHALNLASDVLGDQATIAELRSMADELLGLEDPRIMAKEAKRLQGLRQTGVRDQRVRSGVDVVPGSMANASMNSDQQLVNMLVQNPDSLSPEMFAKARSAMQRGVYPRV